MFSDEILIEIFNHEKVQNVPLLYQTIMVHAIEEVLEDYDEQNADSRRIDDSNRTDANERG